MTEDERARLHRRKLRRRRRRKLLRAKDDGAYICPTCGERIVIPLDPSAGSDQSYGEDCPVCCNPNQIHVEFFAEEGIAPCVWAEAE